MSLVAVVGMGVVDLERAAPGPVSAVHALAFEAEGLEVNECSACHGGWFESMAGSCFECHDEIDADMEAGAGLHGILPESVEPEACGTCHGEHNGPGFQLAGPRSFKLAGAGSREEFDHGMLGFEFEGAHLDLDCTECHVAADALVLDPDESRFRGLQKDCASCHESENDHAPVFPKDCTLCHDQSDWTEQRWDRHQGFFVREGAHAEASCRDCHAVDSDASLEVKLGRRGGGLPEVRDCSACHEVPHSEVFLEAGLQADGDCAKCHETALGGFSLASERMDEGVHGAAGFGLDAPHDGLDCTACHAAEGTFAERFSGRSRTDCAACHDDPHAGQFAPQEACISCHAQDAFEPHLFDKARHEELALPLTGAHGDEECAACHAPLDGEVDAPALRFRGTDESCTACHEDAHGEFAFAGPGAEDCATCHSDVVFREAREGFGHGARTGFELRGAHGQEDCEACHLPAPVTDASGRRFGRVADLLALRSGVVDHARVVNADCALCHEDVHAGAFGDAAASCAECHSDLSFRTGMDAFDHGSATGFSLGGGHAELDCTACHADDASAPRGRAAAKGADCASCHDEPHAGQFVDSPRGADCARCHAPEAPFAEPHFDHDVDSDFPLEGRHRELLCAECHGTEEIEGGAVQRFWPVDADCAACHGVVEGGRLRRSGGGSSGR